MRASVRAAKWLPMLLTRLSDPGRTKGRNLMALFVYGPNPAQGLLSQPTVNGLRGETESRLRGARVFTLVPFVYTGPPG